MKAHLFASGTLVALLCVFALSAYAPNVMAVLFVLGALASFYYLVYSLASW